MTTRSSFCIGITLGLLAWGCSRGTDVTYPGFGSGVTAGTAPSADDPGDDSGTTSGGGASGPSGGVSGPAGDDTSGGDTGNALPSTSGPGGSDGGGPGGTGDCCTGHETPGCEDEMIETCVCTQDSFCCDNVWDDLCASMVVELGCAPCDGPGGDGGSAGGDTGGDDGGSDGGNASTTGALTTGGGASTSGGGPIGFGDCCQANGSPGCDDAAVESCVCDQDSYCCDTEWDGICVDEVDSLGCGTCGGGGGSGTTTGGTGGGGMAGECCEPQTEPGCMDAEIESCVCADDGYCCTTAWDSVCVSEVDTFGCGTCKDGGGSTGGTTGGTTGTTGDGGATGDCCSQHGGTGCSEAQIETCVCEQDDYCCTVQWDALCVEEVDTFGCGTC